MSQNVDLQIFTVSDSSRYTMPASILSSLHAFDCTLLSR